MMARRRPVVAFLKAKSAAAPDSARRTLAPPGNSKASNENGTGVSTDPVNFQAL